MIRRVGRLWRRSLQTRVVTSTVLLVTLAVGVVGWALLQQVADGLTGSRTGSAVAEARSGFEKAQAELDVAVEVARESGAVGARMTGGGFGGSAIALVPVERLTAVRSAVTHAFALRGWRTPEFIDASPGPGAHAR